MQSSQLFPQNEAVLRAMQPPDSTEPSNGGYTALPNALLRVWLPSLSGAEAALLVWVIQDTLSWHREDSKPTSFRVIATRANVHRHSIERAISILTEIGLVRVREADQGNEGRGLVFSINSLLLQNPLMDRDHLVQNLDHLRTKLRSKKGTAEVPKRDIDGPKIGPMLVQKLAQPYEESKEKKEGKELASSEAQELEQQIRERVGRSRLAMLGGVQLNDRTVSNIRLQMEQLTAVWQVKEVLETMEHKCSEFARRPGIAESWGLVVRIVRDEVLRIIETQGPQSTGAANQKPWVWLTAEERTKLRLAEERTA